jgi:hypothetical protein
MLSLNTRVELLTKLGAYMLSDDEQWIQIQDRAVQANAWFTPAHISLSIKNIATQFLQKDILNSWIEKYTLPTTAKKVGIVAAGNIPLVGFHDFMCGFMSGHDVLLKLSSKDDVLLKHLVAKLAEWEPEVGNHVQVSDMLKGCDAYITTGSNNTARYFEQYFGKFPHIIRKNRTSVAILDGTETEEELSLLADDVFLYFGLGCRNVTQVHVPAGYEFEPMLKAFSRYMHYIDHNKYKNNYDYHLALYLLNRVPYMNNDLVLMVENEMPFSAVSVLHYRYYSGPADQLSKELSNNADIQCVVSKSDVPFGMAQRPGIGEYADGVDTMEFLTHI